LTKGRGGAGPRAGAAAFLNSAHSVRLDGPCGATSTGTRRPGRSHALSNVEKVPSRPTNHRTRTTPPRSRPERGDSG
jgi:hypothetical protein